MCTLRSPLQRYYLKLEPITHEHKKHIISMHE